MAISNALADARQYLYRYGTNTDVTIDPVDLIRDLVKECEKHEPKKPKARTKQLL